jgi:autotransporter-associated beta strand protein
MYKSSPKNRKRSGLKPHFIKRLSSWLVLSTSLTVGLVETLNVYVEAAPVYWDVNGGTAGASDTGTATGTWDGSSTFWNDVSGTGIAAMWNSGDIAVFAAGGNATNAYTVTVSGTQGIGGLTFEEGIVTLAGGTLQMTANSAFDVAANLTATVNSVLDGAFNLTKTGAGTLVLGGANTYTGRTIINAGTVSISSDGNLGTAPGGATADSITFGGTSTLQITGTANPTIASNRGITIGDTFTGTVQVVASANTVTYGGVITGSASATFKKTGAGTLVLQGDSSATMVGTLNVDGGTLKLSGAGSLGGTTAVTLGNRATLSLDNSGNNVGNRTAGAITSNGGTIEFIANAAVTTETLGALTLNAGALTINSTAGAGGSTLTIPTLTRSVVGGTLYLNGTGLGGASNQIVLGTAPALVNSVLKYAVVNDGALTAFANYTTSAGTNQSVKPLALASHNQGAETTWVAASNARPTADLPTLAGAARSLYTLTLDSGIDITAPTTADRVMTIGGAVLQTGGVSIVAQGGGTLDNVLAFGANEAIFHILGSLQLDRGNTNSLTGTGGFTKSGAGTLILNGVSTLSGAFNVNEGILELRGTTTLMTTAATVNLNGATLRLSNDAGTTFTGNWVVTADSNIQVDRVTAAATATTHTIGTLSIGGGRTLSVAPNDITTDTAYGLTAGSTTITSGGGTFNVANNGTAVGTMTVGTITHGGNTITKTGAGDFLTVASVGGLGGGLVDVQAGRVGWSFNTATPIIADSTTIMGAGGIFKTGGSVVNLTGTNTFTGGINVTTGELQFSTVSNNGGSPSNLGQGTDGLVLNGGTLNFIGGTNQSTNRGMTLTASSTLNAGGGGVATITYAGPITTTGNTLTLTGTSAGSAGTISGGVTQTGTSADLAVNSGTWTLSGATSFFADDVIVTGATAVLNLNSTGVLAYTAGTSNGLYARTGANINLGANDVTGVANSGSNDFFFLGDTGLGTLNMGAFNVTTLRLDIGDDDTLIDSGVITGTGTLTVTNDFNLYRGSISVNLVSSATMEKFGNGDVTLSGDNSGLTTAGGATTIFGGNLILDYTTSNAQKISSTNSLSMQGGTLTINGNATANTSQTVLGMSLTSGGWNTINVSSGGAQSATLNLGAISRTVQTGTIRFGLPVSGAITTTTANVGTTGVLGGWATVTDPTGTYFAKNDGLNNIVAVATTTKNIVSTWAVGDQITDDTTGFTGTLGSTTGINTLRFNAAGPSTVTIGDGVALGVNTGGVLQTSSVTAGKSLITGGRLVSGASSELIFTTDSATQILEVASTITGTQLVTKTGLGTLRLSGNNSYTGTTRLMSGTIQVSGGKAIGDTSSISISSAQDTVLELLSNETVGTIFGGVNGNLVVSELRLNGNALTVNQGVSNSYSGLITGTASSSLIKTGSGNFQLTTASNPGFLGTVTVNQGLFYLSVSTTLPGVTAYTINRGSLMTDGNGTTTTSSRIADTATITLNSADGNWSGETRPSGLVVRRDQGSSYTETVGVITLNSGASYARLDATVTSAVAAIVTDNIVRLNGATFDVRGTLLSATTGQRSQLRIGTAGNQTAFIAAMVGGGSTTLGTKNISIVPWAISEEYASGIADANMGNSLATYVSGGGFRALTLATEYNTYTASAIATENIRESLAADLTGLSGKTINALVVNNSNTTANTINFTGTGAGQTLALTSGTMLFTATGAVTGTPAMGITLGGFDAGITVGATNEFVIFVQNPTSASGSGLVTATISSPLTSTADITKSGRGTLVLSGSNLNAGGGARKTTINEGVLQIADLDNIGGNTGNLVFAGGTLKLGAGFVDDLSTRTISFLLAGGTLDTNGIDLALANSVGSGIGGFTKIGTGNLTLNGVATYTGSTTIGTGTVTLGASGAIGTGALTVSGAATLAMGTNNATVAGLTVSNAANVISGSGTLTVNGDANVNRGTISPLLAGSMNLNKLTASQTVTLSNTANTFTGYTHVQDGTLSIASLANAGVASSLGAPTGDNAAIRLGNFSTTGVLIYTGGAASTDRMIVLPGTTGGGTIDNDGSGALTLPANITGTEYGAKTLTLQGATTGFTNVVSGLISDGLGALGLTKAEAGTWSLTAANTFTGATTISAGVLHLGNGNALQNSAVTVTASNGLIFAGGIGTFTMASLAGAGNLALTDLAAAPVTVVAGSNNTSTTYSGAITGSGALVKLGTGTFSSSSASSNFSGGLTVKAGTYSGSGSSGAFGTGTITLGDTASNPANVALTGFISNGITPNSIVLESGTTGTITIATTNASTPYRYSGPITGANHLTVAANASQTLTFSNLVNNGGTITNAGTGTGVTTLSGGVGSNVTGIIQNSATSPFVLSGPNNFSGAITVNAGTLSITGALNTPSLITGLTVNGGATLNLVNGSGVPLSNLATLSLGAGTGTATLGLELGSTSDLLTVSGAATTANTVAFNLTALPGFVAGTYDLISASSGGLSGASYVIGNTAPGGFTYSFAGSTSLVVRLTATAISGDIYWRGGLDTNWSNYSGGNTNWTTDLAGSVNANATPGALNTVIFSSSTATGPAISTTLNANFAVNDLKFTSNPIGITGVTIAAGTPSTSSLTIAPSSSAVGIDIADNAGAISVSAPVVLGANQTWTVSNTNASLAMSGGITGSGALTKAGPGTFTLTGTNTYNGATTVSDGILLGGAANSFSPNSAYTVNDAAILRLNGLSNAIGSLAGNGTVQNNHASTAVTLTTGSDNINSTFSGTIQNGAAAALALTKVGTGTFTVTGALNYTGNTIVTRGTLVAAGSSTATGGITVGNSTTNAVLNVPTGGTFTGSTVVAGTATGSFGAVNVTGGTMTMNGGDSDSVSFGNANGGYGAFTISGGSFTQTRFMFGGTSGTTGTGGIGVGLISGGTVRTTSYIILGRRGASTGVLTITGGTIDHTGANQNLYVSFQDAARGELNVAGGLIDNTGRNVTFGGFAPWTGTGVVNLNAGTLLTNAVNQAQTTGTSYWNFNGGTLKSSLTTSSFFPTLTNTTVYVNGAFGAFTGGAVIDTNGFDDTIGAILLAPVGDGVASIAVATQGSGYIGAPYVSVSGTGTGATAIANMVDDGTGNGTFKVASITITNPGVNYTGTPTFTLTGGGATTAATAGTITTAPLASGGLTKNGAGILTLSGANTYTGGTTVNVGTLALGANDVLANAGAVTVNGGALDINTRTETVGAVTLQSGSITGTTGVLTASSYGVQSGSASAILGGAAAMTKTTAGTVTLSGVNTFSGPVMINAGTLAFSTSANLGNASATNTISLGGGTLSYTGAGALDLGVNRVLTVGSGGGTLDVPTAAATLTFSGGVNAASTGNLVKSGPGTVILSGATNLNGGTTTVSGGLLKASFGTAGTSAISVGPGAVLHNVTPSASTLVLPSTGSLTLTAGATLATASNLGFGLNGSTAAGITLTSGGTLTINGSGTVFLDVLSLGTPLSPTIYNLLSVPDGGLLTGTGGAVSYALDDVVGGYTYTLNQTSTLISVTVGLFSGSLYWHGDLTSPAGSWLDYRAGDTNWRDAVTGGTDDGILPGALTTVVFSATEATGPAISTTLDADVMIKHLQFTSNPVGVTSVTIAQGTTGSLTIGPASSANGIDVGDNAGAITISAPLVASTDQTWNVAGTGANGSSLTSSGGLTGAGDITKTGTGALAITAANSTYNGDLIWSGGALTITPTGAGANNLVFNGVISGSGTGPLLKNGTGNLILNGANTYSGGTTLNGGLTILGNKQAFGAGTVTASTTTPTLQASADLSGANALANNFILDANLTVSGTNNLQIGGTTTLINAGRTLTNNLTGPAVLTLGGNVILGDATTARTLTVTGTGSTVINGAVVNGPIAGGSSSGWLVKNGTGTLTLGTANTYTGFTIIDQGTLTLASGVNQSMTNTFYFGSSAGATSAGTLDLSNASATFTVTGTNLAFWNQINSTTATPAIVIGAGQSLNLNGNVLIGNSSAASTTTLMTASGLGTINVTNANSGASFRVGGYTGTTVPQGNRVIADLSGLATLNISLNTTNGTVAVSNNSTANTGTNTTDSKYVTLTLANTTTITAKTLVVGDGGANNGIAGQVNALRLGSVVNNFNVDTINIGTGLRDLGSITFNNALGTLNVHGVAGTSARTAFAMGTNGGSTGGNTGVSGAEGNTFNTLGHTANLMLGAVAIGTQNRGHTSVNTFSFDQGTLDMTSLTLSTRSANGTTGVGPYTTFSTVNLGGGDVDIQSGILQAGLVSGGTNVHAVTATINISGAGTVDIGATSGTSIQMASSSTATGTATSTLNVSGGTTTLTGSIAMAGATTAGGSATGSLTITGGTLIVGGNISRAGGAGTTSATVTLNGGTLDMTDGTIGAATAGNTITFVAQQGNLKNLDNLNGGGTLTKTSPGILNIEGVNDFAGLTDVTAGKVVVSGSLAGNVAVAAGAELASGNNLSSQVAAITAASAALSNAIVSVGGHGDTVGSTTVGRLNATGNVTLGSGIIGSDQTVKLRLEIGGAAGGTEHDQIQLAASSQLTLANADLVLNTANSFNPTTLTLATPGNNDGSLLFLFKGSTLAVSGFFQNAGAADPFHPGFGTYTVGGQLFAISYQANFGAGQFFDNDATPGTDVALMPIPEPNSLAMLAGSLGLALGLQRFRRRTRR